MFSGIPKTDLSFDMLIRDFSMINTTEAKITIDLLENTRSFLLKTDPSKQQQRGQLSDTTMQKILDVKYLSEALEKANSKELKNAIKFCIEAIQERMKALSSNGDPLFSYYDKHENTLKTFLNKLEAHRKPATKPAGK